MIARYWAGHRERVAVCGLMLLGALVALWLCRGPGAYTRPRFLPAVAIRRHGSNEAVLKMMVSYTICDALNMPVQILMGKGNLQG